MSTLIREAKPGELKCIACAFYSESPVGGPEAGRCNLANAVTMADNTCGDAMRRWIRRPRRPAAVKTHTERVARWVAALTAAPAEGEPVRSPVVRAGMAMNWHRGRLEYAQTYVRMSLRDLEWHRTAAREVGREMAAIREATAIIKAKRRGGRSTS